jgi:hypothetical protein
VLDSGQARRTSLAIHGRKCQFHKLLTVLPPDDLICAALCGDRPAWSAQDDDPARIGALLDRIDFHGAHALLHALLPSGSWPPGIASSLRLRAVRQAMWELRHQQILAETLAALHAQGIEPVLFKGTALAYSLYADPALRSRGDTDLIIPFGTLIQVREILTSLGYELAPGTGGQFTSYQASYVKRAADGTFHALDLHWKINNSELLSRLFTYEELRADAVPLPALSPHALGTSRVHGLLLACMHRSTHKQNPYSVNSQAHYDANRIIWLYDIHMLAKEFDQADWKRFSVLATQKGLRAVCLDGIQQAQARLRTGYPESVRDALTAPGPPEPAMRYLASSKLRQEWMDFCALENRARQIQMLGELLFPSATYMRGKYADRPHAWLPWLYLHRAAGGLVKRLPRADVEP